MHISHAVTLFGLLATHVDAAYPIVPNTGGVNQNTGERPDRLEINGFASKGGPAWDLFVLCLKDIQSRPQTTIDSWYQIAGIHGRPYNAWDNVKRAQGAQAGGYCPHSSVLFPTWHRPYIQLLEQNIWQCAQTKAKSYPSSNRNEYISAAVTLRFPYWDWVAQAALPPIVTQTSVVVNTPSGRTTVSNPLFQYSFQSSSTTGPRTSDFPGTSAPQAYRNTVRTPTRNGASNHDAVNAALKRNAAYLHDTTYLILTQTNNYAEFSNNGYPGSIQGYGSIENPHGAVHNAVGGSGGHMSYLDYAGHDPIFWLHHVGVDRLVAIWQAIHPDSWQINQRDDFGTFSIAPSTETDQTKLYPFSKDSAGTFYTSNDVRDTRSLGYTYPEIRPWGKSAQQNSADVRAAIQRLYDPNNNLARRHNHKCSKRGGAGSPNPSDRVGSLNPPPAAIVDGKYKQWTVNLEVNKFALNSSFVVYFFMGAPASGTEEWLSDINLIGSYPCLRPMGDDLPEDLKIYGTVPLTRAMLNGMDDGHLKNLEPENATPYLRENLQWRIADMNGVEIPVTSVASLKIFVADQEVTPPSSGSNHRNGGGEESSAYPVYGKATAHLSVTEGKPGSAEKGDDFLHKTGAANRETPEKPGKHEHPEKQDKPEKPDVPKPDVPEKVNQSNNDANHGFIVKGIYRRAVVSQ
ncbi:photo-regulated tyrosinase [Apiospora kogelbergensis]|uniref:tyrosinase n=1 Tax=Apiospora kogelbergensis TaxID=1337665 RepID=A0AAW0QMN1_9PEZI